MLTGQNIGDSLCFQVVDKDGLYAPAGTVLNQFGTNIPVDTDAQSQDWYDSPYVAYLYQGLYIRVKYTSTGVDSVNLRAVVRLHKPVT